MITKKLPIVFKKYLKGDTVIWTVVIILSIFSILAVYTSTGTLAFRHQGGNTEYYLGKHFFILLLGFFIMYLSQSISFNVWAKLSKFLILFSVPLLIITILIGTNLNDASRWITLPVINLSFQTSDFAKLSLIMFIARVLAKKQENIKDFKSAFLPVIIPILLICGLILPSNFSTAAILFVTCYVMMFIARINTKYMLSVFGIGSLAILLVVIITLKFPELLPRSETWKSRIESFTKKDDPEKNFQPEQAKIAIATGGIFGKFPGNSVQRNFLPHSYSDFIYAILIEEYGLVGGMFFVFLYLVLFYRAVKIATRSPRIFPAILVTGISFNLVFQAFINMAVATNLLPVTGQPLPLVSMGGTSLWFTSVSLGIILSASIYIEKELNKEKSTTYQPIIKEK